MDDCSPDDTASVVSAYSYLRVRYIRNEPNLGHLRNYNKGINLAQGQMCMAHLRRRLPPRT